MSILRLKTYFGKGLFQGFFLNFNSVRPGRWVPVQDSDSAVESELRRLDDVQKTLLSF